MNKSILVIDTPKCCSKCPLFSNIYTDMTCRGNGRTINYPFPDDKIQDWCPLKDVPEERNVVFDDKSIWAERRRGWNACIEEIIGENI